MQQNHKMMILLAGIVLIAQYFFPRDNRFGTLTDPGPRVSEFEYCVDNEATKQSTCYECAVKVNTPNGVVYD